MLQVIVQFLITSLVLNAISIGVILLLLIKRQPQPVSIESRLQLQDLEFKTIQTEIARASLNKVLLDLLKNMSK